MLSEPATYEAYRNTRLWQWEKCEDFEVLLTAQESNLETNKRHLLTRCRLGNCFKPVDKVYGILSLVGPAVSEQIVPNYEFSARDVYMAFTTAWIKAEADLEFLIQCGETGEGQRGSNLEAIDLPSWVPDLRKQTKPQLNNFEPEFNAHGGTKASFDFVNGGTVLSVDGIILDKLDGLSGTRHWDDDWLNARDIVNPERRSNAYGNDALFQEALWRALMGDRNDNTESLDASQKRILDSAIFDDACAPPYPCPVTGDTDDSWRWNMHLWLRRNASFMLNGRPLRQYFCDLGSTKGEPGTYYRSLGRVATWMWSRKLCVTEQGYIGIMPRVAKRGDVVAILLGCSCPMLLRPSGDMFQIVAECYVQGVMQGEVISSTKQKKRHHIQRVLLS